MNVSKLPDNMFSEAHACGDCQLFDGPTSKARTQHSAKPTLNSQDQQRRASERIVKEWHRV